MRRMIGECSQRSMTTADEYGQRPAEGNEWSIWAVTGQCGLVNVNSNRPSWTMTGQCGQWPVNVGNDWSIWIVTGQRGRLVNVDNVPSDVMSDRPTSPCDTGKDDWAFFTMTDHACIPLAEINVNAENIHGRFDHWPWHVHVHYLKMFRQNLQVTQNCSEEKLLQRKVIRSIRTSYRPIRNKIKLVILLQTSNTNTEYHITHTSSSGDGRCVGLRKDRHDVSRIRSSYSLSYRTREANVRGV